MGLAELFCENVENTWLFIENNKEDREYLAIHREMLEEYLISNHLAIQSLLGFSGTPEVVLSRIKLSVHLKWYNVVYSLGLPE